MTGTLRAAPEEVSEVALLHVALQPVYQGLERALADPLRAEAHLLLARASLTDALRVVPSPTE